MRFRPSREASIGLAAYALALGVRACNVRPARRRLAARNMARLVELERRLGVHVEPALQRLMLRRPRVVAVANLAYVGVNIGLTLAVLHRLYVRRSDAYFRYRRAAVTALAAAQCVFLPFPCEPPRRLGHFVNASRAGGVDIDARPITMFYNPVAAMPSIHMAWAVVVAAAVRETCSGPATRALAAGYPPAVALTVLVTANHLIADVAAGAALGAGAVRSAKAGSTPWLRIL